MDFFQSKRNIDKKSMWWKNPWKSRQNCLGVVFLPVFPSGGYRTYSNLDPLGGGESLNYVYPVEWSACTPLFTLHFMYLQTFRSYLPSKTWSWIKSMCGAPIHGIHAVGDIDEADDGDGSNENDGGKALALLALGAVGALGVCADRLRYFWYFWKLYQIINYI